MTDSFGEPWVRNYLDSSPEDKDYDYYLQEIWGLALLSRGVLEYIDTHKVKGDEYSEDLCKFVLGRFSEVADFTQLVTTGNSEYLKQIKTAQGRLKGLNL
jgi:hypothetical protein